MNSISTRASKPRPRQAPARRARACLAGAALAASLALASCGGSSDPTILDTQQVEAAIEQSVLDQRGEHADVGCPAGVHQEEGVDFSCQATVKRR